MVAITRTFFSGLIALALLISTPSMAEQYQQFGDYQVHYNAVNTSFLTPEVAAASGITRSRATGFLNVSVLKVQPDGSLKAVNVPVDGSIKALSGQDIPLPFRTLRDGDSIYRLATFGIQDGEAMRFTLNVGLERDEPPVSVNFMQRLYVDP
ncbi:DUF4426 domain-containing protein [Halomonas halocynthiae]|uniref:DUF4426 domain-containing protein n=1 Tax=Halomonas halocynthiae TaxID=176290 RepID=UPI0003F570D6|nr:DUF4426 domain-containing protein [Halomonas halocynthiae]